MQSKPFEKMSSNVLSNFIAFFTIKEGLNKFRLICKKFNASYELYLISYATEADKILHNYSQANIDEIKIEFMNNLTIINRINTGFRNVRLDGNSERLLEQKV